MKLFDDNSDSSDDDLSKIEINHEYAKRLEHNKKREELQRYEELKKQGRIDDSDASSDDEEELFKPSKKFDSKFFDALIKIKKKDPILNDKDAKLFDSDDSDESDSDSEDKGIKRKKEKKPMYLKDVVSKQLIEEGPEFDDEEENGDEGRRKVKTYSDEQEELKRDLLKAVEEAENDDGGGELFKVKNDGSVENEEEGEEEIEKLNVIFGEDDNLDKDDKFLKGYFLNKMWIDDEKSKDIGDGEIEYSEDEEEIEKQEDYEREFNFRFEENAGDRVMGHSRKVEGSVRKVHNARKLQRERKEERMAQAEFERKEELKHLKNLKRKEINEKLEKIKLVAGDGNIALDLDDLEEDFDPEEHDRKMKEAYGDEYYKAEDIDPNFGSDEDGDGVDKPDFDKEDELLGLPKDFYEVNESSASDKEDELHGLSEVRDEGKESGGDEDNELNEGKQKRKRKSSALDKARALLMDDYHKLDYEGVIGDLKTRFKYKPVPAKRFGLNTAELLLVDEKELNQYVPLKKLAPYREEGWKVDRGKILEIKKNLKEQRFGGTSKSRKKHKSQSNGEAANEVVETLEDDKSHPKESNDNATLSRSKRRHSMEEYKPTQETSKSSKEHKSQSSSEPATEVVKTLEDEKSRPKESNDETTLSRRSRRRRSMKRVKPNQSRLEAYGLI